MSVKINSKNNLDSNEYRSVVIRKINEDYVINVLKNKYKCSVLPPINRFTDSLKELTNEEQIVEIIRHFIEDNRITEVCNNIRLPHYSGSFCGVNSSRSTLAFAIPKSEEFSMLTKIILDKYDMDRIKFLDENSNIKHFYLFGSNARSSYEFDYTGNSIILYINLNRKKDLQFLDSFLEEKYSDIEDFNTFYALHNFYKRFNEQNDCNFSLEYDNYLKDRIDKFTKQYLYQHRQDKVKQLKLEGF